MPKDCLQVKGVVLTSINYKENDKILTVLTDTLGKITVRARGVRSLKSRRFPACQDYVYSELFLSEKNHQYTLEEAEPIEAFFELRERFEAIALAGYFADLLLSVSTEGESDDGVLPLFLNALWLLSRRPEEPLLKIKAVFEWRLASYLGYLPNLDTCGDCGQAEGLLWFDIAGGTVLCERCVEEAKGVVGERILLPIDPVTLAVMTFILKEDPKKIFAFRCQNSLLDALSRIFEKYLLYHVDKNFATLKFFHEITDCL